MWLDLSLMMQKPSGFCLASGSALSAETSYSLSTDVVWLLDKWEVMAQPSARPKEPGKVHTWDSGCKCISPVSISHSTSTHHLILSTCNPSVCVILLSRQGAEAQRGKATWWVTHSLAQDIGGNDICKTNLVNSKDVFEWCLGFGGRRMLASWRQETLEVERKEHNLECFM